MAQWELWRLGSTETQVRSLARHSGLRIRCYRSCGIGRNCGLDLIPGLETLCHRAAEKGKEKKKKEYISIFHFTVTTLLSVVKIRIGALKVCSSTIYVGHCRNSIRHTDQPHLRMSTGDHLPPSTPPPPPPPHPPGEAGGCCH